MNRRAWLILIAINVSVYVALGVLYPLANGLLHPRLMWAQQVDGALFAGVVHITIYTALFAVYVVALRRVFVGGAGEVVAHFSQSANPAGGFRAASPPVALIVAGWLVCSLILLFSFPGESADIFDYIFRGRMLTEYGLSPLSTTPFEIKDLPFHRYVSWTQWVDAYGPVWEYASAGVAWLVKLFTSPAEGLVRINQTCDVQPAVCTLLTKYVLGYRLLAVGLTGVCGGIIASCVLRRTSNVKVASAALLVWLWNPLVVVSTAVGAHNDVLMLVFVLLAIWLAQRDRWIFALLAVFAAAHIKLTGLVVLPVMCLWMAYRLGWARAIFTLLVSIVIALPISFGLYAPLGGWATLPRNLYERSLLSTNSIGELIYLFLRESRSWARFNAQQFASRASLIACVGFVAPMLLVAWMRAKNPGGLQDPSGFWLRVLSLVVVAYLAIGSFWFQAWYLVLPVAVMALLRSSKLLRVVVVYCASTMIAAVISDYLRLATGLPGNVVSVIVVGLILVPPLVTILVSVAETRERASLKTQPAPTSAPSQSSQ